MDLVPYYECLMRGSFLGTDAPPPPPGFEYDRHCVSFKVTIYNSSSQRFEVPPQIIPRHRFFAEGADIVRRTIVSSGWAGEWTDEFLACFAENLSNQAHVIASDPRSSSDGLILSYSLVLVAGMFPRWSVERRMAVRASEETAAAEAAVRIFPADKVAVRALKEVEIIGRDEDVDVCCICMDELSIYSKGLEMPCSHVFHTHCLLHWLEVNHVCPLCRYALPIQNQILYLNSNG